MHEMSIVESMLEMLQPYAPARITKIRMRVGAMTAVLPDALQFSFEVLREGTAAQTADLVIEHVPTRAHCSECGADFEMERFAFQCSACNGCKIEVLSGNELDVVEIELEE